MKITVLLILTITLMSCLGNSGDDCECDPKIISYNDSLIREEFSDTAAINEYFEKWSIPPIQSYRNESYRLNSSHASHEYSHMYILVKQERGAELDVRQYDSTLTIVKEYTVRLTEKEWEEIKFEIESNCFWTGPMILPAAFNGRWTIEGYDPNASNCGNVKYHYDICGYNQDNGVGDIARVLKSFAKEERLSIYKYGL